MKEFWHRLSPGLVATLVRCIQFVRKSGKNEFHTQRDLRLSHTEACNFTKLRNHGLVAKIKGEGHKWLITARGGQFLRGEIAVPVSVKTFRNRTVGHNWEHQVTIRDFRAGISAQFPEFDSKFAYEYREPEGEVAPVDKQLSLAPPAAV